MVVLVPSPPGQRTVAGELPACQLLPGSGSRGPDDAARRRADSGPV